MRARLERALAEDGRPHVLVSGTFDERFRRAVEIASALVARRP
jgi:nicotinamide riboside kinase